MREWLTVLQTNIDAAKREDGRADAVDPDAVAFRLNALGMAANWHRQLLGDLSGIDYARLGWDAELDRLLTDSRNEVS